MYFNVTCIIILFYFNVFQLIFENTSLVLNFIGGSVCYLLSVILLLILNLVRDYRSKSKNYESVARFPVPLKIEFSVRGPSTWISKYIVPEAASS